MKVINQIMFISIFFISYIGYSQDYKVGDLVKFKATISIKDITSSTIVNQKDWKLSKLHSNVVFRIEKIADSVIYVFAIPFNDVNLKNGVEKKIVDDNNVFIEKRGDSIVKVFEFNEANLLIKAKANELSFAQLYNGKTFQVDKNEFLEKYEKVTPFEWVTLGVLSLPIKFRLQDKGSFDTHFNIGATVGFRLPPNKLSHYALYGQIGFNLGSTTLTSANSTVDNDSEINSTLATGLLGLMFQYKKIQVGAYCGLDYISNQKKYDWNYHGKPWVSLGIGIDVFQPKDVKVNGQ